MDLRDQSQIKPNDYSAQNQVRDNTASRFTSQLYAGASPATVGTIQPGGSDVWQIDQQYSANYRHGGASTSHMSPGQAPGTGLSGIAFITDSNEQIQPSASGTNLGGFDGTTLLNYTSTYIDCYSISRD